MVGVQVVVVVAVSYYYTTTSHQKAKIEICSNADSCGRSHNYRMTCNYQNHQIHKIYHINHDCRTCQNNLIDQNR